MTIIVAHCFGEDETYLILAAPSCKEEDFTNWEKLIEKVIDTWIDEGAEKLVGPLWSFMTDGDATHHKAGHRALVHHKLLRSLYFAPILFAIPRNRTPNLTMIPITTDRYTPYPPWSRLSHSLRAVHLIFTSWQTLHHAYRTAMHLGASCISSPLYNPYLASCSPHVFLMTRLRPIGYDPLI